MKNESSLAAPIRSQQCDAFAGVEMEVDSVEGLSTVRITITETADFNDPLERQRSW